MFNCLQIRIFVTDILIFFFYFLSNKIFTDLRFAVDYCIVGRMMFHCSQFYIYIFATDDFNIFRNYIFAAQYCIVFAAHCFTRAYFATWRYSCIVCALPTLMLTFPNTSAMSSFLDSVF